MVRVVNLLIESCCGTRAESLVPAGSMRTKLSTVAFKPVMTTNLSLSYSIVSNPLHPL